MTAPARLVHTDRADYLLDPYVRDEGGRFATKPLAPPAPIRVLEESGTVQVLANGAMLVSSDPDRPNYWRVRCIKEGDGAYRVVYLEAD